MYVIFTLILSLNWSKSIKLKEREKHFWKKHEKNIWKEDNTHDSLLLFDTVTLIADFFLLIKHIRISTVLKSRLRAHGSSNMQFSKIFLSFFAIFTECFNFDGTTVYEEIATDEIRALFDRLSSNRFIDQN